MKQALERVYSPPGPVLSPNHGAPWGRLAEPLFNPHKVRRIFLKEAARCSELCRAGRRVAAL